MIDFILKSIFEFYDNGFYYPDIFLLVLAFCLFILLIILFRIFLFVIKRLAALRYMIWYRRVWSFISSLSVKVISPPRHIQDFIILRAFPILIIIVLLVGVTRMRTLSVARGGYPTPIENALRLPLATDLGTCVIRRTGRLLNSQPIKFRGVVQSACGYTFPVLFALIYNFLDVESTALTYRIYLSIIAIGYVVFFFIVTKRISWKERGLLILCCAGFILGIPGAVGILTGNVDIALALAFGFLVFGIMKMQRKNSPVSFITAFLLGLLGGAIVHAKLFLFPLVTLPLLFSRKIFVSLTGFFIAFIGIAYVPRLFGSESSFFDFIQVAVYWAQHKSIAGNIDINFSLSSLITLGTDCLKRQNCDNSIRPLVYWFLASGIFLTGLWPLRRSVGQLVQSARRDELRGNPYVLFTVLSVILTAIILLPKIAYGYRLYYSFVVVLLSYPFIRSHRKQLYYWLLSIIFLLFSGLWFVEVKENGFWIFDARIFNVFLIGHFVFLMRMHALAVARRLKNP